MDRANAESILFLAEGLTKLGVRRCKVGDVELDLSPGFASNSVQLSEDTGEDDEDPLYYSAR